MTRIENENADSNRLATADDVRHVIGQIEDVTLAQVLSTRPTYRDLVEAALWARGDGDLVARESTELSAAALAIASVLVKVEDAVAEEDRP